MDFTIEQTKEIHHKIRSIAKRKMKMKEFHERSGVSSSLFSQYGSGHTSASMLKVQSMADTVEISLDELLDGICEKETARQHEADGRDAKYRDFLMSLCGEDQEKFRFLQDAFSRNPEKTKASFDLFLKTL